MLPFNELKLLLRDDCWPLLLLLAACSKPETIEVPPRPALVTIVGAKSAAGTMALVGEVRPRYESIQGFRVNGKIIERKVEVGSLVKKGQLIARLDPADSHLNVAAAQATTGSAGVSTKPGKVAPNKAPQAKAAV